MNNVSVWSVKLFPVHPNDEATFPGFCCPIISSGNFNPNGYCYHRKKKKEMQKQRLRGRCKDCRSRLGKENTKQKQKDVQKMQCALFPLHPNDESLYAFLCCPLSSTRNNELNYCYQRQKRNNMVYDNGMNGQCKDCRKKSLLRDSRARRDLLNELEKKEKYLAKKEDRHQRDSIYGKASGTGFYCYKEYLFLHEYVESVANMMFWGLNKWYVCRCYRYRFNMHDASFKVRWHSYWYDPDSLATWDFNITIPRNAYGKMLNLTIDILHNLIPVGSLLDIAITGCVRKLWNDAYDIQQHNYAIPCYIEVIIALMSWVPCIMHNEFDEGFGHYYKDCFIPCRLKHLVEKMQYKYSSTFEFDRLMCIWKYTIKKSRGYNQCIIRQGVGGPGCVFIDLDKLSDQFARDRDQGNSDHRFDRNGQQEILEVNKLKKTEKWKQLKLNYNKSVRKAFITNLTHQSLDVLCQIRYNNYASPRLKELDDYYLRNSKLGGPYHKIRASISSDKTEWKLYCTP